ncbi:hypothetical protein ACI2L4_31390 [Streptomyces sparsogenes]|uniref:hypothetical protein n=1 Tax=Streptomyces sparsogenes TaxID=67365 RepID=UPI0033F1CB82
MRPAFLREGGAASEGRLFATPFTDPGSVSRSSVSDHRVTYGLPPGRWSPEAHDAVGLVARALESLGGSAGTGPGAVSRRLCDLTYRGLAKTLRFAGDGTHTLEPGALYFLFRAQGDGFRFLGRYDQVTGGSGS